MPVKKKASRTVKKSAPTTTSTQDQQTPYTQPPLTAILVLVVLILLGFSVYLSSQISSLRKEMKAGGTGTTNDQQQPAAVKVSINQVKGLFKNGFIHFGDANRKVLFVEVNDPSCPFCHIAGGRDPELAAQSGNFKYVSEGGTYTPPVTEMKKLVDSGKASYVMLYGTGHGNGKLGTEALYCANEKGKFWEVSDKLMNNEGYSLLNDKVQNDRSKSSQLAEFLGDVVDSTFLTDCLNSAKYEKNLARDEALARQIGFQGTPHFLVNTTQFAGAQDYKNISPAVEAALK